jgi:hypothetical protein
MAERPYRRRGLFWPIVFIGVGTIWLLVNLNLIPAANLITLWRLWPLLLVGIGLDLLFGRRHAILGALIGLGLVAAVVAALLYGAQLGLPAAPGLQTDHFSEPLGGATSAQVRLELSGAPVEVAAPGDSPNLIEADLTHLGAVEFTASGQTEKVIALRSRSDWWFPFMNVSTQEHWTIHLSPSVPLDLEIDGGPGVATLDLSGLQLTALRLAGGAGVLSADLPIGEQRYRATVVGGPGTCTLSVPDKADLDLAVTGGPGTVTLVLPEGVPARVDVRSSGPGSVALPPRFTRTVSGFDDEGVWETNGYSQTARRISVTITDVGPGSIVVR